MPLYKVNKLQPKEHPDKTLQTLAFLTDFVVLIISLLLYSFLEIYFSIFLLYIFPVQCSRGTVIVLAKFVARKPEKEVISTRISTDLLHTLDEKAKESDISRNELINQMILFALANMEDPSDEK